MTSVTLPEGTRLETCWVGFEGLGRCAVEGRRVSWTMPRLAGGKAAAGPFVATADVGRLEPGAFDARAWATMADSEKQHIEDADSLAIGQTVRLVKP